ncbi:MAG: signal peptidase I [Planctomycetota bacterium]|nr:signal peptidase I [Planctomycetota bacterium]
MSRRTPWRDHIEALAMAVIMALLLKFFIIEAYKIPSGSMQPTLIGDADAQIFDRILVDKLSFKFRDPERFEVVVFRYPLNRAKNFVKRLCGIGPEYVRILDGDLWHREHQGQPWRNMRRSRAVQRDTWKRVDFEEPVITSWYPVSTGLEWKLEGRRIEARGDGTARFGADAGSIMDSYTHGYPDELVDRVSRKRGTGMHPVGDIRLECVVTALPDTRSVSIRLKEGQRDYLLSIPGPAARMDARPRIESISRTGFEIVDVFRMDSSKQPYRLPAGEPVRIGGQNLDDLLELDIDGEVVCSIEIDPTSDQRSIAYVEVEGEGADFDDLMVYRDIYYLATKESEYFIPEGMYFMLGDNTQDSSDSREWVFDCYAVSGDDGTSEVVRGSLRKDPDLWQANPAVIDIGNPEGALVRLEDQWGEAHWFRRGDPTWSKLKPEESPFVPRSLILGRALAVFWPLNPRQGIYRLKWIH